MRSALAALALGVVLVLVGAGCGGIDTGKLESAIKDQTNTQLDRAGRSERVSTVSCVKTTDGFHYTSDTNTQWYTIDEIRKILESD